MPYLLGLFYWSACRLSKFGVKSKSKSCKMDQSVWEMHVMPSFCVVYARVLTAIGAGSGGGGGAGGRPPPPPQSKKWGAKRVFAPPPQKKKKKGEEGERKNYNTSAKLVNSNVKKTNLCIHFPFSLRASRANRLSQLHEPH